MVFWNWGCRCVPTPTAAGKNCPATSKAGDDGERAISLVVTGCTALGSKAGARPGEARPGKAGIAGLRKTGAGSLMINVEKPKQNTETESSSSTPRGTGLQGGQEGKPKGRTPWRSMLDLSR